jgi:hypothetical protein
VIVPLRHALINRLITRGSQAAVRSGDVTPIVVGVFFGTSVDVEHSHKKLGAAALPARPPREIGPGKVWWLQIQTTRL